MRPLSALLALGLATASSGVPSVRFEQNPIIRPELLPGRDGQNINGPSLIRVPAWVSRPLGRYYLYFAHHRGSYLRLAHADALEGPWRIYEPGVLRLREATACVDHVASPDVVVDETARRIRLYFHCPVGSADGPQKTFLATSTDGLRFQAGDTPLGDAYFRVFRRPDAWYAMAWGGRLFRSSDGVRPFESGPNPFPGGGRRAALSNSAGPRHVAIHDAGGSLWVYYSSIGDEPERILRRRMDTEGGWSRWRLSEAQEVLRPETGYEGADLPLVRSRVGDAKTREHALRDPFVFSDSGRSYLLYSVAAESGIAIAELK
jgi:hypothetical protein